MRAVGLLVAAYALALAGAAIYGLAVKSPGSDLAASMLAGVMLSYGVSCAFWAGRS